MPSALFFCLAPVFLSIPPQLRGADDGNGAQAQLPGSGSPSAGLRPEDLGGELYDAQDPPVVSLGMGGPNTYVYQLNLPHQRWKEDFVVVRPDPTAFPPPRVYPVLTLFHGSYETPLAVLNSTPLALEAANRGWLVVIPLGAHTINYGIDYAQDNIEDVFEHIALFASNQQMPLFGYHMDLERVYAVGFSMGGGAAASYAARHLDPDHVRFAAVVNHTGSTSLRDTYNANIGSASGVVQLFEHPLMFGGRPLNAPFRYQRSSAIDLKPGNIVDPETDMVRNLLHVPIYHFSASNDPVQYLVTQSYQMHLRLLQHWGGDSTWATATSSTHSWATLAPTILNWLQDKSLRAPTTGTSIPILADRDGRWHYFELRQTRDKQLSPFTVEWSSASNSVSFTDVANVASLEFDVTQEGLRLSNLNALQVTVQTRTLEPLDIVLRGYTVAPIVQRGFGVPGNATWDAQAQTLTLHEVFGVFGALWSITP